MWADSGHDDKPGAVWVKKATAITLLVVKRTDAHSFQVVKRRWVVERTFGWLMRHRRLARDYERTIAHHEAVIYWTTAFDMTRRLARYETGQPTLNRWGGDRKPPELPEPSAAVNPFINRLRCPAATPSR